MWCLVKNTRDDTHKVSPPTRQAYSMMVSIIVRSVRVNPALGEHRMVSATAILLSIVET